MEKPPVTKPFDWPRIPVDETRDSPFATVLRIAVSAADTWVLGPTRPLENQRFSHADITHGQVREALLHLLELGLVDIDVKRLAASDYHPTARERRTN